MKKQINNIYTQFIEYLSRNQNQKKYTKKTKLEKHRILPQHAGGTYEVNNVVLCRFEDHRLAHFYRYLAYEQKGDLIAWQLMRGQNEEARYNLASYAGKIGGKACSEKNKAEFKLFYSQEWQLLHGYKRAGQRNVESGHLAKLNQEISKNCPEQRSKASKLGVKARISKQQTEKTAFFDETHSIQKKANLVRWGIKIDNIRVPFEKLSSDFVDYYLRQIQNKP
uniref:HNH endonuclease n=1 Tax=Hydrocytium acuminatum TaxID=1745963 RepID=UPI002A83EA56|nr:HNH endonuclease [Hydrocytium acuminatum]WOR09597.1 HNH endonuclease [Hydrocytium acuminatum]